MFKQDVFQGPGTGTFSTHTFEILLMLFVAGLIGLWLGWLLWSRYREQAEQLRIENASLLGTADALRKEISDLKAEYATLASDHTALQTRLESLIWENNTLKATNNQLQEELGKVQASHRSLSAELGLSLEPEAPDEGIPLEIAALPTHVAALDTNTPAEAEVDPGAATHTEADTQPPQSTAAFSERALPVDMVLTPEEEEPALQPADVQSSREQPRDDLGAQRTAAIGPDAANAVQFIQPVPRGTIIPIEALSEPPALPSVNEAEPLATPALPVEEADEPPILVIEGPRDDLKVIEGIGPKIERLLFSKGITTYGQLAATSVQQLKDILVEAGPRYAMHDPGTWSAQALLAANGEWENLKAYQEFLHGGKRPEKP